MPRSTAERDLHKPTLEDFENVERVWLPWSTRSLSARDSVLVAVDSKVMREPFRGPLHLAHHVIEARIELNRHRPFSRRGKSGS